MAGSMMESFLSRFSANAGPAKEQAQHPSADPAGNGRPEGLTCREAEIQQPKMETNPEIIRMTLT